MAYIVRIDHSKDGNYGTHGFQARLHTDSGIKSKFFADRKHGGAELAHLEATRWLDKAKLDYPKSPPYYTRGLYANNTSGVNGVSVHRRGGQPVDYCACVKDSQGNPKVVHFTVTRFGDEALALATEYRKAWEQSAEAGKLDRFFAEFMTVDDFVGGKL